MTDKLDLALDDILAVLDKHELDLDETVNLFLGIMEVSFNEEDIDFRRIVWDDIDGTMRENLGLSSLDDDIEEFENNPGTSFWNNKHIGG